MLQHNILLIDDDLDLCQYIAGYLTQNGFGVRYCQGGEEAIAIAREQPWHLIVLDLMLPGLDGISICRSIRKFYNGPIMMFTALDEEIDEVAGLESGADDYLKKPVSPRLLLARIRVLLRRGNQESDPRAQVITINDLSVDFGRHEVSYRNRSIQLSTIEFELLAMLVERAGTVVARDAIFAHLRRFEYDGLDRSVDLCVSRIRRKLGDDCKNPRVIKTIRSSGYMCMRA